MLMIIRWRLGMSGSHEIDARKGSNQCASSGCSYSPPFIGARLWL